MSDKCKCREAWENLKKYRGCVWPHPDKNAVEIMGLAYGGDPDIAGPTHNCDYEPQEFIEELDKWLQARCNEALSAPCPLEAENAELRAKLAAAEAELAKAREDRKWLKAELAVRTFNYGIPSVPEKHRGQRVAYDSGYRDGWMGRIYQDPYTSVAHSRAFNAGHQQGAKDAEEEIAMDAAKEGR